MSSRDYIIKAIQANKPTKTKLPAVPVYHRGVTGLAGQYKNALLNNKGIFHEGTDIDQFFQEIKPLFQPDSIICSLVPEIQGNLDIMSIKDPHELANVDLAIVKSGLGVAENAALWLSEESIVQRALPFVTQHLLIILDEQNLVADMHQAYEKIKVGNIGYGVFIAGPSKTADIEQSLIIGAHGARSLTVFLRRRLQN